MVTSENEKSITFAPFCLDLANECLWHGTREIKLRPKAFALLHYLLCRPGQLVTKEQLLDAIWPETFVGEAVLKVAVRQIREALGDDSKSPRFIETAHRRGYRFIGQISETPAPGEVEPSSPPAVFTSERRTANLPPNVVGRAPAMSRLDSWLEKMLRGERQIIFVTGEAGIGKTALVDAFARRLASSQPIRITRGQCLEQYGTSEAFLPVLEAIGRLCREQWQVVDLLRTHAPMWLLQLPSLVSAAYRESLSREVLGATRERMLREIGEALQALTAEAPLVLILEDLHWSDYSTLDLISYLARQRQPAQLMVIGTYRPAELMASGHPLKAVKWELLAKQQCEELPLDYLDEAAVAEYLALKFPTNRFPAEVGELIHSRTDGNPLFMVNTVDYLVAERLLVQKGEGWELVGEIEKVKLGVPDTIRHIIEKQIDHLSPEERRLLEAASVAGAEFSTPAVAAGLAEERGTVETRCGELARQRQFLRDCGVQILPNGEAVGRYGFIHALYQNVLYEMTATSRRVQLHRRIAERGVALYGERAREIAAELAMHFERGASYRQAVEYLQQAADNAIRRVAYHEAVGLARRGLELLETLPENRERDEQELCLQLTLGVPLIATEGYAAPEVGRVYLRARKLCHQLGETPDVSEVLWGLWTFYTLRAEFVTARKIAEEILQLAEQLQYAGMALRGHWALEITSMQVGEFQPALEHFEKALALYAPERHVEDGIFYALNPGVAMPCFAAWTLWFLGYPNRAFEKLRDAVTLAHQLSEPLSLAHALLFAAILHQLRGEAEATRQHAEAAVAVSRDHGLILYEAMAKVMLAWALIEQGQEEGALEEMRAGLAALQVIDTEVLRPHFLALQAADALGKSGRADEGIGLLNEALAMIEQKGERYYEAELYRLKGELVLKQGVSSGHQEVADLKAAVEVDAPPLSEAESCFHQAIRIAREQQAKSWELRAVTSLAQLYRQQGREEEAFKLLSEIYGWFNEGFDTTDLRDAKALIERLSKSNLKGRPTIVN
jgi:DNA-binding winged helix-turn-helix (wHTH) protein/tetratricopeptide (TPR) repeat protein